MVSPACEIVGHAKHYTLVWGQHLPPAKVSIIAGDVWLVEKTGPPRTFLVFGNDRQVPELWLQRYRSLVSGLSLHFPADDGLLEVLREGANE